MTIIFGVNLCDRIYIAADSRLSSGNAMTGIVDKYKDKIVKVEPISKYIIAGFAGNAHLASFVVNKLIKHVGEQNIREFRQNIKTILGPIVEEYWATTKDTGAFVRIIFGGINPTQRKDLTAKNVYEKIIFFSNKQKEKNESGGAMNMKPALFNTLMASNNQPLRYPEPADSHLFSIEASYPYGFIINDAEWGEFLLYGPEKITKEQLPDIAFGKLEFETKNGDGLQTDNMLITLMVKEIAETHNLNSVGGVIFTGVVTEGMSGVITGSIYRANIYTMVLEFVSELIMDARGVAYSKDKTGKLSRLTRLKDFKDFGSLEL